MRKRSYIILFWGIYLVAMLSIYVIIPRVFPSQDGVVDFVPFFFFFPFISLGRNRSNQNGGAAATLDGGKATEKDRSDYEYSNINDYSEFGMSPRKKSYLLYYIGIGIIAVGIILLIYFLFQ
ncbi:hypothetical protein OXIME_001698 [Oxyplasma meridianum]|uniref:Uncharacterized protein n=1 Tax=Oxyplasma meridianum TaxID=3073602 RepID=A0AAX4NJF5_9ARCH